jgi:pantoate--beta-alanine ligase
MEIFQRPAELRTYLDEAQRSGKAGKTGFVPTMGALHEGHMSLMRRSSSENDLTVCSIFVNPTQFTESADLTNYPRPLEADKEKAAAAGCDVLFIPTVSDIYPENHPELLDVDFGSLESVMEGAFRKGHFRGVATVVFRLFNIVKPDRAYFGEKDYQQLLIIRRLAQLKGLPIEIISCPTVREPDGLALSSRNIHLTGKDRRNAVLISRSLFQAQRDAGRLPVSEVRKNALETLSAARDLQVEYFEIVDGETLQPIRSWDEATVKRACVAARVGSTRLIDNIPL